MLKERKIFDVLFLIVIMNTNIVGGKITNNTGGGVIVKLCINEVWEYAINNPSQVAIPNPQYCVFSGHIFIIKFIVNKIILATIPMNTICNKVESSSIITLINYILDGPF